MKKKLIAIVGVALLVVSMATAAYAAVKPAPVAPAAGNGFCGGGGGLMWDEDGNFLDKEAFEANVDKLIEDGFVVAEDKDALLELYDWCAAYGGGATGTRGGGCGMGRGMDCGMGRGRQ